MYLQKRLVSRTIKTETHQTVLNIKGDIPNDRAVGNLCSFKTRAYILEPLDTSHVKDLDNTKTNAAQTPTAVYALTTTIHKFAWTNSSKDKQLHPNAQTEKKYA